MTSRTNPRRTNGARRDRIRARVMAAYDVCYLCGKPVDKSLRTPHPLSGEVDEIIPVSRGGSPYDFSNCRLAHRACNRVKSNKSVNYARAIIQQQGSQPKRVPFITSDW